MLLAHHPPNVESGMWKASKEARILIQVSTMENIHNKCLLGTCYIKGTTQSSKDRELNKTYEFPPSQNLHSIGWGEVDTCSKLNCVTIV